MILLSTALCMASCGITRTCGGDPDMPASLTVNAEYYPHMRGWSSIKGFFSGLSLSITRTCGGDPKRSNKQCLAVKYYPHMRGWSAWWPCLSCCIIVLPAHAGVILINPWSFCWMGSITRTCGGDPFCVRLITFPIKYYPHMRGWSSVKRFNKFSCVVLPAHAGVILSCKTF